MAPAYGLYTHIRANRIRSVLMLAGLFLLIYVVVYACALVYRALTGDAPLEGYLRAALDDLISLLPAATVAAIVWIGIAYSFHQWMIDRATGSHGVTRREEPRLYNLLENLCISRGVPMPRLKIMETSVLNAFASGLNQRQYTVTVTRGLIERLDDAEIEAVLAHELTHIRNGDVRVLIISLVIAGAVGFLAEIGFRAMFRSGARRGAGWGGSSGGGGGTWSGQSSRGGGGRRGGGGGGGAGAAIVAIAIAVALIALAWFLSQVVRFSLSRSREFLADAGAVELTQNPDAMITALRKLEGRSELPGTPSQIMEMCIDNPHSGFVDLFATHPTIDRRVEALVRYAGGRDPGPLMLPSRQPTGPAVAMPEPASADPAPMGMPFAAEEETPPPWNRPPLANKPWNASPPPDEPWDAAAWDIGPWGPRQPPSGTG